MPTSAGVGWAMTAYAPHGTYLYAIDEHGRITIWNTSPAAWLDGACGIVARPMTDAEWSAYLPRVAYTRTC